MLARKRFAHTIYYCQPRRQTIIYEESLTLCPLEGEHNPDVPQVRLKKSGTAGNQNQKKNYILTTIEFLAMTAVNSGPEGPTYLYDNFTTLLIEDPQDTSASTAVIRGKKTL